MKDVVGGARRRSGGHGGHQEDADRVAAAAARNAARGGGGGGKGVAEAVAAAAEMNEGGWFNACVVRILFKFSSAVLLYALCWCIALVISLFLYVVLSSMNQQKIRYDD